MERSGWIKRHKKDQVEDAARRKTGLGSKAILSGRGSGGSSGRTNGSGHHQAEDASVRPANLLTPVAHKKRISDVTPCRFSRCIGSVKPLGDHLSPNDFTECIHHFLGVSTQVCRYCFIGRIHRAEASDMGYARCLCPMDVNQRETPACGRVNGVQPH